MKLAALSPVLLAIAASQAPTTAPATAPATRPAMTLPSTAPATRVVLHVNRNTVSNGQIALEDDNVITIRNTKGELESHPKSRLLQIVRLVDPKPGQTGLVYMRDGAIRRGEIVEDTYDYVLVRIEGINTKLVREAVSHVVLEPTVEERYARAKASLQPGNYEAHLMICQWLFEQRRYEYAKKELDALLSQTEMPEARRLLTLTEAQLALAKKTEIVPDEEPKSARSDEPADTRPSAEDEDASKPAVDGEPAPPRAAGPVYPSDLLPDKLLSAADVNVIRVYEIDFSNPPKVSVSPDTVRTLIEKYGTNKLVPSSQTGRNEMFRAAADRPLDLVRLMFELRARDLYPQVQVNSEPHALNFFRQRIHDTWLMNNCATSRCHGGPEGGNLFLFRKNYKSDDRVRYTNLLILERLKLDPQWPLINYDDPESSLLIQYGLPREFARKPHPAVEGWKEAFRPTNPRMKDDAIEWIRSMMQPRPDYPVDFEPPRLRDRSGAASRPDSAARPAR